MPNRLLQSPINRTVVEAYRLDRYDNLRLFHNLNNFAVVEAYRLDRYDNFYEKIRIKKDLVVEAYRWDRYDNPSFFMTLFAPSSCRSLSFG